jgi:hypothetical protein
MSYVELNACFGTQAPEDVEKTYRVRPTGDSNYEPGTRGNNAMTANRLEDPTP